MVKMGFREKFKKVNVAKLLGIPFFVVTILFIALPFLMIILYSFKKDPDASIFNMELTFNNYYRFFKTASFMGIMGQSVYFALITTAITILIGYPLAYFISLQKSRLQSLFLLLITAPIWINMLIRTLALKQIINLGMPFLLGTRLAVVLGMVYIFLPFMVVPIYSVISKIDKSLYEAGADLGANSFKVFIKIILPLSRNGIYSGILMVFLPAATSLIVPQYLGNGRYLIGNVIEAFAKMSGNIGISSAITIVLSIFMIASIALINVDRLKRRQSNGNKEKAQNY